MTATAPHLSQTSPEVIVQIEGNAGIITLSKPQALNSLSLSIIRDLFSVLMSWKDNPTVKLVIIRGEGKAFCAGGDIRSVYDAHLRGDNEYMSDIFLEEYQLNYLISIYPKPFISFLDGIVMGGGLGISIHGSHRIATEKTVMAMPEAAIGFFTDIGASYFLNQCPGEVGVFLGLTGYRMNAADAIISKLATHVFSSGDLPALLTALIKCEAADEVHDTLMDGHSYDESCLLSTHRSLIDEIFAHSHVEEILGSLYGYGEEITTQWAKTMEKMSPTSLKVILKLLRHNKNKPLKQCLSVEYDLSQHFVHDHDFFEGIRALLVDKDQRPLWSPSSLDEVSDGWVDSCFSK